MTRALLAAAPLCFGLAAGCSGPPVDVPAIISERFCLPSDETLAASWAEPTPAALPGLSERAHRVAVSIGAAPALAELLSAERPVPETRRLRLRQQVLERIVAAQLDVQEALALLDCEGERGDQLRGVLQAREARRTTRLTLASIGFGAATAVATGGLALAGAGTASAVAGIAGGSAEASAGAGQLFGTPRGLLQTRRNLLREARDRPARSTLLPAVVWRYLTRPGADGRSVLDEVAGQWRGAALLGEPGTPDAEARAALLHGDGGAYSAEDLMARGAMLDGLEAAVGRMSRSLGLLLSEMDARLPRG
jgi:hypothetical protein